MFSLSRLERDVTRRVRALRGIRGAGIGFVSAISVLLAASIAGRARLISFDVALSLAALAFVGLALLAGYLVGYARRPRVPRLLLQIDLALATGERLSSLHELRARDAALPLQRRIEERLQQSPPAWRRVLRLRPRDALPWVAGSIALGLAAFLVSTVPPPPPILAAGSGERSPSPRRDATTAAASSPADAAEGVAAGRLDPGQGEPAEPLVDTLAQILSAPPSRGLLGDLSGEEEGQDARPPRDPRDALSDLLSQLMSRGQFDPWQTFALTEQEKEALRDLLEGLPSSALRQSLSALLGDETGDSLRDRLADSQRLLESLSEASQGEGNADLDRSPEERSSEEGETSSLGWVPPGAASEGENPGTQGGEPESGFDVEGSGIDEGHSPPPNEEGGATAGRPGPGQGSAPPAGAGFLPEELLGILGPEGNLRRFLTKGVPFEPPVADPTGTTPALLLDYETLRALLEARGLAPDVQALVRTYFETITQGGP